MSRKRMLWQLYPSYILIIILTITALAWYAIHNQRNFYLNQVRTDLQVRAELVERLITNLLLEERYEDIDKLCKDLGKDIKTRITVILPSGVVVGDSNEDPKEMENHGNRPEIREALRKTVGSSTRRSNTLQREMMYVALPVYKDEKLIAIARASFPVSFIQERLSSLRLNMMISGFAIAILAALVSLYVSSRVSRPLEHLKKGAERFSRGFLNSKLLVPDTEEIASLAEAMNEMAGQLNQRIITSDRQRQEQEAILSSMAEGVLAVNTEERIININQVAARFFHVQPDDAVNKMLQEVIRNTTIHELVHEILHTKKPVKATVTINNDTKRFLQVTGSLLRSVDQEEDIGVVIVLNDVTRINELENLRRDFVANVSHELRTPITSIKGFVETLQDGAIEDREDTVRFLNIIARHADRLNAIIEDLLSLSRIEQGPDIAFEPGNVSDVISSAIQTCQQIAESKGIRIVTKGDTDISYKMNFHLLEQALVNLIDNAIKFSPDNSEVEVSAVKDENEIRIEVADQGIGIESEHQPRIFERFYRVDKSRSRELGGTGLGLAIVKHIALAHKGKVSVNSIPGLGSQFTISLPL